MLQPFFAASRNRTKISWLELTLCVSAAPYPYYQGQKPDRATVVSLVYDMFELFTTLIRNHNFSREKMLKLHRLDLPVGRGGNQQDECWCV